jgi:phage-related protein (TIGR01555 family)
MAKDDAIGLSYGWATQNGYGISGQYWLGYGVLAELSQVAEYRNVSETYAKEMTRKWIRLNAAADKSKNDRIRELNAALKKYKVRDCFRRMAEIDGLFGRAHLFPDFGIKDDQELVTPLMLRKEKIAKGSLKRLQVVEPIWTYPGKYNSTDPLQPDFYKPSTWYVMGKEINSTRLLTFIGREMPDLLKAAYMFGGISRSQLINRTVTAWLRDRKSVSDLVNNFSTCGIKTDIGSTIQSGIAGYSGGGAPNGYGEDVVTRVEFFNQIKANGGMFLLQKGSANDPGEEFFNVSVPLGTLDKLQAQSQEHICADARLPLIKFTGITPSGLNASSSDELRSFADDIHAEQEDFFADNLEIVLKMVQLSEFGDIDETITAEFIDMWSLDEAGKVAVQKTKTDIDAVNIQEGIVSAEEVRERISADLESQYSGLDLSSPPPDPPDDGGDPSLGDPSEGVISGGFKSRETGANSGE